MDGIITLANGSSSSLYGCVGCAVKDMIISKFPNNYFKYTSISSELATRSVRRSFGGNNSKIEIAKRQKPFLYIQPTYSVMDQDGPLQNIPLTKNFDNLQYRVDKRYLFEVIRDKQFGYNLKFKLNRDRIEFDVTVTTATLHQQLDIYRTIMNQIMWDRSYSFRIALEAIIPKPIIGIISKYCNMDLEKNEEYIPILLRHLNSCSGYPITYKLRNASSTDEWFMYYTHNVIITFTDLTLESGNKKNMADDYFNITFKVIAEFNLPGVYVIDGNLDQLSGIDVTLKTKEYNSENDTYFPLYTVRNLYSRFPAEMNGMQLYGTTIFKTSIKTPGQLEDRIDIKCVLDNDHIRVIRSHKAWNMNPDTLMNIFVLKDSELLNLNKDYYIDWNTLELVIKKPDDEATYRLIMYFNYATVNEILSNTSYNRNYDVNKLHNNKFPNEGIKNDIVFVNNDGDHFEQQSDSIYDTGKVPPEKKDDDKTVELEKKNDYCGGKPHEGIEDPDVITFKNKVIINNDKDRYHKSSDSLFLPNHVDPKAKDPVILEDDPTYCKDEVHDGIDRADDLIYRNRVVLNDYNSDYKQASDTIFTKDYVNPHVKDPVILEDDPTYCKDEVHDDGIPFGEFSINLDDDVSNDYIVDETDTNADIHNSSISTKKKFSSSV